MTNQQIIKEQSNKAREVLRRTIHKQSQQMTREEWERLESKKQITSSEKTRFYMRVH